MIAATRHNGHLLVSELAEKPDPLAARELERRHGTANLFLLEGRARLTPEFVSTARTRQISARTEPKLALAIAGWVRWCRPAMAWRKPTRCLKPFAERGGGDESAGDLSPTG